MESVPVYQTILDAAFAKHFPGWAEMSPLDPVKVLAEGIASALGAVEERQRRVVDSALDSLPSLFAVRPKEGRLPVGLFQLRPALRVREMVTFDEKASFRFQNATETMVLTPVRPFRLSPVAEMRESREGNRITAHLTFRGPAAAVTLAFLPAGKEGATLLDVSVTGASFGQLFVEDGTEGFTQYGELSLRRRDQVPLVPAAAEIIVQLTFSKPLVGRFLVNVFPFHFGGRSEGLSLGALRGEAWEEIALPETMPGAPTAVLVSTPDGRERRLELLANEALRLRHTEPALFANGFLYHGARHAIVIPAGDLLVGSYNGGVELRLPAAVLFPKSGWLGEDFQSVLAEHVSALEAMIPVAPLLPAVPRETSEAYLGRFYAMWRAFRAQQGRAAKPALLTAELEQELLGSDSRLRAVEVSVDAATATVTAHCLAEHPEGGTLALDSALAASLRARLSTTVPLPYQARLRPFRLAPLEVGVTLRVFATEERLEALTVARLDAAILDASERRLRPPPFGALPAGRRLEKEELAALLHADLTGAGGPLRPAELSSVELTLRDEAGQFLASVSREAGQCLQPKSRTKVDLRIMREVAHA